MAEKESKRTLIIAAITLLIGTVLGSGGIWQWKQHELDKVMKTTDLRKQENDLYSKIIEISEEYGKHMERYDLEERYGIRDSNAHAKTANKMHDLKAQLDVIKDDFKTLEIKLSQLEGREPRNIALEFIPPHAVTSLTVGQVR